MVNLSKTDWYVIIILSLLFILMIYSGALLASALLAGVLIAYTTLTGVS